MSTVNLVLASASPRRQALLAALGLPYSVVASNVDETLLPDEPPESAVRRLAVAKARAVVATPTAVILAADTDVVLDGAILGKPTDPRHAGQMLRRLAGRDHLVYTGLAVRHGYQTFVSSVQSRVWLRQLSEQEIGDYVATGESLDKAGAYGAQDDGGRLIEQIDGCYLNVVGLPLCEVLALLRAVGLAGLPVHACRLADGRPCPRTVS